jgi:hypothetical protein
MAIKHPEAFADNLVEMKITQILKQLNVKVLEDHILQKPDAKDNSAQSCLVTSKNEPNCLEKVILTNMDPALSDDEEEDADASYKKKSYDNKSYQGSEEQDQDDEEMDEEERRRLKRRVTQEARLLVTSGRVDVDFNMFLTIHERGLVYNGRLIIKNNFQTTDDSIFACGKLSEFSHRYKNYSVGTSLRLDKYSGREIGQRLSKSLLEYLGVYTPEINEEEEADLPTFYMPIGTSAVLPCDLKYYHIQKVAIGMPEDQLN